MKKLILATAVAAFATSAHAAQFSTYLNGDGMPVIKMDGKIVAGDAARLRNEIEWHETAVSVRLNSPGGDIAESFDIASVVAEFKLETIVGKGDTCSSACFNAFAAGSKKWANREARIGVHSAAEPSGRESQKAVSTTTIVVRTLKEAGVPPAILGKMVTTTPDKMAWLTEEDLTGMGVRMTGKAPIVASDEPMPMATPASIAPDSADLPNYDVNARCARFAKGGNVQSLNYCIDKEQEAYNWLKTMWGSFSDSAKRKAIAHIAKVDHSNPTNAALACPYDGLRDMVIGYQKVEDASAERAAPARKFQY